MAQLMSMDGVTTRSGLRFPIVGSLLAWAIVAIACLGLARPAVAQNLVQNPGFEDSVDSGQGTASTTPDWAAGEGGGTLFSTSQAGEGSTGPNSGDWYAVLSSTSANQATASTLSQTITTTPNTTYIVSFYLANEGGPHNTFLATFGGQTVLSLTDSNAFGYRQYSMTVVATSASTVLAFTGEQDPASFGLDDVSVEAEGAPAPVAGGGIASICVLIVALSVHRMRRRKA